MQDDGGEEDDQTDADDELGDRCHRQRGDGDADVEEPVGTERCGDAEADGDGHADGTDDEEEAQGIGNPRGSERIDAPGGHQRGPEVAGEEAGQPDPVLHRRRTVQVQLEAQRPQALGRGAAAKDRTGRVAGQDLSRGEDDDRDQEEGHATQQDPPPQESQHRVAQDHEARDGGATTGPRGPR